jgi:hypothetical protein
MFSRRIRKGSFVVLPDILLMTVVFEGYDSDHDGIIRRKDVTIIFQAMWSISCRIFDTTIRSDEEEFENMQAANNHAPAYASLNTLTNRLHHRSDESYPLSSTFYYPPPSSADFTRHDSPSVQGNEAPSDILPHNDEDEYSQGQLNEAETLVRNKTFEEMERVIDEIFEGGLAETGINFERFRELAVGPHGRALMGWIDMLRTVF